MVGRAMARVVLGIAAGAALLLGAGCTRTPQYRPSEAMQRSRALLDKADAISAELHAQNAELWLYDELGVRRQVVSEVACQVANTHVREIERLAEAQKQKRMLRHKNGRKVAMLRKDRAHKKLQN
jgi:hypothetical protein